MQSKHLTNTTEEIIQENKQQLPSMHKELLTEFVLYIMCLTLSFSFETSK